jgi:solute carrier family 35, member C2
MSSIRYARVKSTINDENSDDNVNQLQTIDSGDDDEEDILPSVKIASSSSTGSVEHGHQITHGAAVRKTLMKTVLWTGLLILCYFILSIGLTFYQRWLLKVRKRSFIVKS